MLFRSGVPCSTISPLSMKMTRSATERAKPISWVTHSIVMPERANSIMTSSTFPVPISSSPPGATVKYEGADVGGRGHGAVGRSRHHHTQRASGAVKPGLIELPHADFEAVAFVAETVEQCIEWTHPRLGGQYGSVLGDDTEHDAPRLP